MATKRLEIIPRAMAREIMVDGAGKARAVSYVDKTTGQEKKVRARAVVVAASACESARLLLNSRSEKSPNGLANSSGVVGRYLTDTLGSGMTGYFPQMEKLPPHDDEGAGGMHMFIPWWKWNQKRDFLRGYHIEFGGGRQIPTRVAFMASVNASKGLGVN